MNAQPCSVDDCGRPVHSLGYCQMHYQRFRRNGTVELIRQREFCSINDCERSAYGNGYCQMHYQRIKRTGVSDAPGPRKGKWVGARCLMTGCDHTDRMVRGYCQSHYQQLFLDEYQRKYYIKHRDKKITYQKALYEYWRVIVCNIRDDLLARQGGRCAICHRIARKWALDHDQSCCPPKIPAWQRCGKCNRGALCYPCNTRLGWYERRKNEIQAYLGSGEAVERAS